MAGRERQRLPEAHWFAGPRDLWRAPRPALRFMISRCSAGPACGRCSSGESGRDPAWRRARPIAGRARWRRAVRLTGRWRSVRIGGSGPQMRARADRPGLMLRIARCVGGLEALRVRRRCLHRSADPDGLTYWSAWPRPPTDGSRIDSWHLRSRLPPQRPRVVHNGQPSNHRGDHRR